MSPSSQNPSPGREPAPFIYGPLTPSELAEIAELRSHEPPTDETRHVVDPLEAAFAALAPMKPAVAVASRARRIGVSA